MLFCNPLSRLEIKDYFRSSLSRGYARDAPNSPLLANALYAKACSLVARIALT